MSEKWKLYEIKDNKLKRKNRTCARCGDGVFLAEHGNRYACGRCGYTVWKGK